MAPSHPAVVDRVTVADAAGPQQATPRPGPRPGPSRVQPQRAATQPDAAVSGATVNGTPSPSTVSAMRPAAGVKPTRVKTAKEDKQKSAKKSEKAKAKKGKADKDRPEKTDKAKGEKPRLRPAKPSDLDQSRPRGKTPRLRTVRETSAGGLVIDGLPGPRERQRAALIGRVDRRGRMMWSLPKGHIETGETAEQTAMREVEEETGVSGRIVAPLGKIDYWFVSDGRRIHKTVHHYLLRWIAGELSAEDYEVSEVAWVPLAELATRLTYSDERRLARIAERVIADLADDPDRLALSEAENDRTEPNEYEKAAAARNSKRTTVAATALRARRPARRRGRRGRGPWRTRAAGGENPGGDASGEATAT